MAGLRDAVSNPMELDLAHVRREPFHLLFTSRTPPGCARSESTPDGRQTHNYYPWGLEQVFRASGDGWSGFIVRYGFPVSDTEILYAHCVGSVLEGLHPHMTGRDFSEPVTELVARRWPTTFRLLLRGSGASGWPALVRLKTSELQWAVSMPLVLDPLAPDDAELAPSAADQLLRTSATVMKELATVEQLLPELVMILGGDDYTTRNLKKFARFFNGLGGGMGDVASVLKSMG